MVHVDGFTLFLVESLFQNLFVHLLFLTLYYPSLFTVLRRLHNTWNTLAFGLSLLYYGFLGYFGCYFLVVHDLCGSEIIVWRSFNCWNNNIWIFWVWNIFLSFCPMITIIWRGRRIISILFHCVGDQFLVYGMKYAHKNVCNNLSHIFPWIFRQQ